MKKFLVLGLLGAVLFGFTLKVNKQYSCETLGVSLKDNNNRVRNIAVNDKTKKEVQKALGSLFSVKLKEDNNNEINFSIKGGSSLFKFKQVWKGYRQYISVKDEAILMPDKNATSKDAALILPTKKIIIYYRCQ